MSRRTAATIRRPPPHLYQDDDAAPGTCSRCHLLPGNNVHVDQLPAVDTTAAQAEARRRYGEREDPDA